MAVWSRFQRGRREESAEDGSAQQNSSEENGEDSVDERSDAAQNRENTASSAGAGASGSGADGSGADARSGGAKANDDGAQQASAVTAGSGVETGNSATGISKSGADRGPGGAKAENAKDANPETASNRDAGERAAGSEEANSSSDANPQNTDSKKPRIGGSAGFGRGKLGRKPGRGLFGSTERRGAPRADDSEHPNAAHTRAWMGKFRDDAQQDSLLNYQPDEGTYIELSHAHPSGLAQLLTSRKTRLSTLIRESADNAEAMKAARALRAKFQELSTERGLDVGYLAAGRISWSTSESGQQHKVSAPVLLINVTLGARTGQQDYELQLIGQAQLNPALVRQLQENYGIDFDPRATARLAYSTARFDPAPVLEQLRVLTATIPGVKIESALRVGAFADLGHNLRQSAELATGSPVVQALTQAIPNPAKPQLTGDYAPEPWTSSSFVALDERAPQDEFMVQDADRDQQLVLDVINAGKSVLVSAPPATGGTQTAINALASLAYQRKSVLVVAQRRSSLAEVNERLGALNLGSMVLALNAHTGPTQLRKSFFDAILRNEKAAQPQLSGLHSTLVENRHQLVDHLASLRDVRQRWGCSPYQAMQSLAELTSITPAPATTVRLKRSVLDSIKDRGELGGRLRRAAELGSFSDAATTSPWHGAGLLTRKETDEAHALAEELATELPKMRAKMDEVCDFSQISKSDTVSGWGENLALLGEVRQSLDQFTPDIFDAPVTDLINATASPNWRRERNLDMPAMQRSRLRRVAREYVRPGVHLDDLHSALVKVEEQSRLWAAKTTSQRHPAVPSGMADLRQRYEALLDKLAELSQVLDRTAAGGDLQDAPVADVEDRLKLLALPDESLTTLPERTLLENSMREQGLGELLDDLGARNVTPAATRAELELAWWQSALEAMISGDEYLAMSDGGNLRKLEAEYRLADEAHVDSGPGRLRWRLAQAWSHEIRNNQRASEYLRSMLKDGRVSLDSLVNHAPSLVTALTPVWTVSPILAPNLLPAEQRFDAVVLLDAQSMSLQSVLPSLARAEQVIAFGDAQLPGPAPFTLTARDPDKRFETEPVLSAFDALAEVLPTQTLKNTYRSADEDLSRWLNNDFYSGELRQMPEGRAINGVERAISVQYLPDGTGLPSGDASGVEGVPAEVKKVVQEVLKTAREHPHDSLAVITGSELLAARVAEGVRQNLVSNPDLAEFFSGGDEPFRILHLDRCAGLVRDRVIFSLGYGRTPHGRALHHFGALSEPGGRGKFLLAMTRARKALEVISCFKPDDLDTGKLSHGGLDFYELLDREMNANQGPAKGSRPAGDDMDEDPLVADLADRLRARDARVWYNYDSAIDIVAAPGPVRMVTAEPDEIPAPVAVESDGSARYAEMSVRERSRLWPQQLERHGWRYVPLWTIEVFTDPSGCADRISSYLGLSGQTPAEVPDFLPAGQGSAFKRSQRDGAEPSHGEDSSTPDGGGFGTF